MVKYQHKAMKTFMPFWKANDLTHKTNVSRTTTKITTCFSALNWRYFFLLKWEMMKIYSFPYGKTICVQGTHCQEEHQPICKVTNIMLRRKTRPAVGKVPLSNDTVWLCAPTAHNWEEKWYIGWLRWGLDWELAETHRVVMHS